MRTKITTVLLILVLSITSSSFWILGNSPAASAAISTPVSSQVISDSAPSNLTPECMYYYGGFNATVKQRLISTLPRFVVLNTPGGSYKGLISSPTPSDIAELKAAGIKVLSYISTGNMVNFQYASDSPPNNRAFVRGCIETVAAEGCDGIFFDEGGIGNWRDVLNRWTGTHADRYYQAPDIDMYGNPNSWAGYTIEDYASYTHSFGMIAVLGTDFNEPQYLIQNVFQIFDYILTDENYTNRAPEGSEIGYASQCWVIGYGQTSASTAAQYTNNALNQGFGAAYHCASYGTLASWYENYVSLLSTVPVPDSPTPTPTPTPNPTPTPTPIPVPTTINQYTLNIAVQGQGTTNYGAGTVNIPANQVVKITATPASGWTFRTWSWPGNNPEYAGWTENPTSWTMVEPISIVAIFDQAYVNTPEPTLLTPSLKIETTNLPVGQVGKGYYQSLVATGGTVPYTWTINSGILPAGLTLTSEGVISGNPTIAGTSILKVQVNDSNKPTSSSTIKTLSLSISKTLIVTTNRATNITRNSAIFNGTLIGQGSSIATLSFEWGTDTNYTGGNVIATPSTWNSSVPKTFKYRISSLKSKTTYHFRAKAVNLDGTTVYGNDFQFKTP